MNPQAPRLSVRHLRLGIGNRVLLDDVSFDVPVGHSLAIMGPNGCGKTSLLKAIAGLFPHRVRGEILCNNSLIQRDFTSFVETRRRGISLLFQDLALWPHMTVRQHLQFAASSKIDAAILQEFELDQHLSARPHQLSEGARQRLALLRALVAQPAVLLLDEPFSSASFLLKERLAKMLRTVQREWNLTTIHVTHDPYEACHLGDTIGLLGEDGFSFLGTRDEFLTTENAQVRALRATMARWHNPT